MPQSPPASSVYTAPCARKKAPRPRWTILGRSISRSYPGLATAARDSVALERRSVIRAIPDDRGSRGFGRLSGHRRLALVVLPRRSRRARTPPRGLPHGGRSAFHG